MITQGERRDFIRMSVKADVLITRQDGTQLEGCSHNLSATGLSVAMEEPMTKGEDVTIFINSSGEGIRPLEATASVVRVEADAEGYEIGLVINDYK